MTMMLALKFKNNNSRRRMKSVGEEQWQKGA